MHYKQIITILFLLVFLFHGQLFAQNQLTNLPTIYITTDDGIDPWSKEVYQSGRIIVKSSETTEELNMITEIRGRGNSTWNAPKKPYRIKLDEKTKLLNNNAKDKSWVLLANYKDKSLIRNAVAFKISEMINMTFSPSARFVDLVMNGNYAGNYLLTDQINVDKHRVPVEKQDSGVTGLPAISGGYLLEIDGFANESWWFRTSKGLPVTIKYPDDDKISMEQYNYIHNFTQRFEDALFSANFSDPVKGYRSLVDETSLINWYIACELTGNPDSFWSTYLYKFYNNDKFFFGPLWDFDIAFNNDSRLGDATRKLMRNDAHEPKTWIRQLWRDDWFKRAVYVRWMELMEKDILNSLLGYVDNTYALITASQKKDQDKWRLTSNYKSEVEYIKTYLKARVAFLTESFESDVPIPPSIPFVADNYYYMIMNVKTNNVVDVKESSLESNTPLNLMNAKEDNFNSQRWIFKPFIDHNETYFRIINQNSGLAMTGNGKSNALTQAVLDLNNYAQMWQVIPVLVGDKYGLVNLKTGLSANNYAGSAVEGTPVIEYDNRVVESENQQWYLKKMELYEVDPGTDTNDNITVKDLIKIYPNPVTDRLCIQVNTDALNISQQPLSVKIYSIEGRCLYDANFNNQDKIEIPVAGIKSGLYILKLSLNNYRFTEKVIIKY